MANSNIVIKKVLEANLPSTGLSGEMYFSEIGNLYTVNKSDLSLNKITDVITGYVDLVDLQTKNPAIEKKIYLTNDNKLYTYRLSDTSYQPLGGSGTSTTFTGDLSGDSTSQKVTGIQGNIIEDVSYGIGDLLGIKANGKFGKITPATAIGMTGITMIGDNIEIGGGEEKTFTHPTSTNIVPYVVEQIAGSSVPDTHVDFSDSSKYNLQDSGKILVGNNKAQLNYPTKLLVHFDDNTFKDTMGHTTINNNVVYNTSIYKFGTGSGYFNGSSKIVIDGNGDLNFGTGDFSIHCWVYWSGTSIAYQHLLGSNTSSPIGGSSFFRIKGGDNKLQVGALGLADPDLTSISTIPVNVWTHVAVTRSSGILKFFINGNVDSSKTSTIAYNFEYNGSSVMGCSTWDGANGWYSGYIDEMIAVKGKALYTSNFIPSSIPDSTTFQPLYAKTTGLSNYSITTIDTITSLTIPVTLPTNTSVKILTSFDNRTNWLYHDGLGWHKYTGDMTIDWTNSNSNTDLQTYFINLTITQLTSDLSSLGIVPINLDMAFQLNTTSATITPTISPLTMVYTPLAHEEYADIGKYDSVVADYGVKRINNSTLAVKNLKTVTKTIKLLVVTDGSGSGSVDINTLPTF